MAPSAAKGKGRKPAGLLRLVALAASLCAVVPSAATSQDVEQSEYRAAESAYNAALSARDLERDLLDDALDEVTEARQSGDQARYERALAIYQDQARELEQSERELTDAAGRLEQVRRSYLLSVLDELDELYEELPQAPDARGRDLIGRRIDILLADANPLERPIDVDDNDPFPAINIEPGDTPDEIRAKADLLERYAAGYDLMVLDIDAQIELVEQRRRHARMVRDFGADLSRFGDLRVPMGRPEATSDNAEDLIGGEELSQRLEELQQTREFVIERRDVARARAEEFRQRIGGEHTA